MRAILVAVLIFAIGSIITESKDCKYSRFNQHQTKLRETRGFKPEYISTAIGFGKRKDSGKTPDFRDREGILLSFPRNFPHGVLMEILFQAMQKNPSFVNNIMPMQDSDQDDAEFTNMEHLKSKGTLALF